MIAQLKGRIDHKAADHVVIDVGGVGYHVLLSPIACGKLQSVGEEISLFIHTYVREDQLTLYGFLTRQEKAIFLRLISVSGVGPKLALALLSGMEPHDIISAVVKEDLARLNAISGIGKKTAERIVVDLKDKFLKEFSVAQPDSGVATMRPIYNDALSALINLGYTKVSVEKALSRLKLDDSATVQGVIRQVLKELAVNI